VEPLRGSPESFGKEAVALLEGRSRGEDVSFDRADSFVGLFGWIARFSIEGAVHTFHTRRWKHRLQFLPGRKGVLIGSAAEELEWAIRQIMACHYVPLTVDARYAYPLISDSVAGDASSTFGWGVCVGPYIAYGRWSDATLKTLRRLSSEEEEVLLDSVRRRSCAQAEHLPSRTVCRESCFANGSSCGI